MWYFSVHARTPQPAGRTFQTIVPRRSTFLVFAGLVLLASAQLSAALRPRTVQLRYRAVLRTLAAEGVEPALAPLAKLEHEAFGSDPNQKRLEAFWKLKLGVLREVLDGQPPDILIPVVMLHHEAYQHYLENGRGVLAGHARVMATELADFYAEKGDSRAARDFAAWVRISFAANLQEQRALAGSTEFFYKAVALDPRNVFAIWSLGANFEKGGEYERAVEYFERLLEMRPGFEEAELRLTLCRVRLVPKLASEAQDATQQAALRDLERLASEATAEWIRSIAAQERARLLIQLGRVDAAETVLRGALEELPGDQNLTLQLIRLLEGSKRRTEAWNLLNRLSEQTASGSGPRQIYDSYPRAGLEEARAGLIQAMTDRLPLLASGLGLGGEEDGEDAS